MNLIKKLGFLKFWFSLCVFITCVSRSFSQTHEADTLLHFLGGNDGFISYLSKNMQYPDAAKENCMQGRIVIRFQIDTNLRILNLSFVTRVNPILNNEAARVILKSVEDKMWVLPVVDGKKVSVWFTQPISFRLEDPSCRGDYKGSSYYYDLGAKLFKEGKMDDALVSLKKAVEIDSTDAEALFCIAAIYLNKQDFGEGCKYLSRVKSLNTKNVDDYIAQYCGK